MYKTPLFFTLLFLLVGCDYKAQYESSQSETGGLYVVDKRNGKVSKVIDNQLVELPTVTLAQQASQNIPKRFQSQSPIKHNFEVIPIIKFRGDKLLYKVTLKEPYIFSDSNKPAEETQKKESSKGKQIDLTQF
jgi:hypothetical protein